MLDKTFSRIMNEIRVVAVLWLVWIGISTAHAAFDSLPELGASHTALATERTELQLGNKIYLELRKSPDYVDDPRISEYLTELVIKLIDASPAPALKVRVLLMKNNNINAYATFGGVIVVNTGLLHAVSSEDELAAVLSHEIAHLTQQHLRRLIEEHKNDSVYSMIGMVAAVMAGGKNAQIAEAIAASVQAANIQSGITYTRSYEKEADRTALGILCNAGFDNTALPSFFHTLQVKMIGADSGRIPSYLKTHPLTTERIADAEDRIYQKRCQRKEPQTDFYEIKAQSDVLYGSDNLSIITPFRTAMREFKKGNYTNSLKLIEKNKTKGFQLLSAENLLNLDEFSESLHILQALYNDTPSVSVARLLARHPQFKDEALLVEFSKNWPHEFELSTEIATAYFRMGYSAKGYQSLAKAYENLDFEKALEYYEIALKTDGLTTQDAEVSLAAKNRLKTMYF